MMNSMSPVRFGKLIRNVEQETKLLGNALKTYNESLARLNVHPRVSPDASIIEQLEKQGLDVQLNVSMDNIDGNGDLFRVVDVVLLKNDKPLAVGSKRFLAKDIKFATIPDTVAALVRGYVDTFVKPFSLLAEGFTEVAR